MEPKEKITKYLERLIHQTRVLSKEKNFPYTESYDLWKRRVELFLRRVCGHEIADEFKNILNEKVIVPSFLNLPNPNETSEERLARFEKEQTLRRSREKNHHEVILLKTKNLLKAAKDDILLFEFDQSKMKRKYHKWQLGIPHIAKYERGEEESEK